ncbi:hypothetical protein EVAR_101601_1, partial [Eumeta japonica]
RIWLKTIWRPNYDIDWEDDVMEENTFFALLVLPLVVISTTSMGTENTGSCIPDSLTKSMDDITFPMEENSSDIS